MVTGATRLLALAGCVLCGLIGAPAEAKTDGQQRVVERARLALDSFLDDPQFEYMRVYVQNAYAVLIVPEVLKAGFFLGAEYGVGVLLVRDSQSGGWGQRSIRYTAAVSASRRAAPCRTGYSRS
jgi:SH3 domain-containing YSC84-like protein 1